MKLYTYFRSSAAYRVRIALNLKHIPYEPIYINLRGSAQHSEAFLQFNPQGLLPVLEDKGKFIYQSLAILEYLEELYPTPPLLPEDIIEKSLARGLTLTIACDTHPLNNLRVLQFLKSDFSVEQKQQDAWYHHWTHLGLSAFQAILPGSKGPYCLGSNITIADICLIPQLYNARRFNVDLTPYSRLTNIESACMQLDAFKLASPEMQGDYT